jgi:hypothetical protein
MRVDHRSTPEPGALADGRYEEASNNVYVEPNPRIERVADRLFEEAVLHMIERIVAPLGLRVDATSPWVDARLPDGSRVQTRFLRTPFSCVAGFTLPEASRAPAPATSPMLTHLGIAPDELTPRKDRGVRMEIGPQRTINKAGLVAGFAAPLCEPGDGSCESPSASEPRLVLVQLSDEDDSAPRISLFREPAARHRRSKLPCDDPLPRESSRSSVPVVDALLGGRGPRPAADCRGGKNKRRDERDADTHSHMTHLHSNDGLLASSIGSGRWMGDKGRRAPAQAAADAAPYPHDDDFKADRPAECALVHCVDAHGYRLCPRDPVAPHRGRPDGSGAA